MRITLTVQIDSLNPDAWDANFGTGTDPDVVADDVVAYVETLIGESIFQSIGDHPVVTVQPA